MNNNSIFDDWPDRYDQWFQTPMGQLIKKHETALILEMLEPGQGEIILDAGCGTGVFTGDMIAAGADIVGLELSFPMLVRAAKKLASASFISVRGDMQNLPFSDNAFDKAVSVTAIEFMEDAGVAVNELFRVTKPGGTIVVGTLNRLSPWADRRKISGENGHDLFQKVFFRSSKETASLSPIKGIHQTAIHFRKDEDTSVAGEMEAEGRAKSLETGAFLVSRWRKP